MTYHYQLQVQEPGTERYVLLGAMRYREAVRALLNEASRIGSSQGYIWPQSATARRKINNIPWVTNHRGIDYLSISVELDTPDCRRYRISGKSLAEEGEKALATILS